jgi:hypothetical protein
LLSRAQQLVDRVSDAWGNELRCHELVRALHLVVYVDEYKLDVVDGKCGPIEHSWLRFSDGAILDVYVPGRLPSVQIIDPVVSSAYRPGAPRRDVRQPILDRLVTEMRGAR